MDLANVTFGETAGVIREESLSTLHTLVLLLHQKIVYLEKELKDVKAKAAKSEEKKEAKSEELVDHRYQIYFSASKTTNEVIELLKEIVAHAIALKYVRPEQPYKIELVEDSKKADWKAVRLTTKGCSSGHFRGIGKIRVAGEEQPYALKTRQPDGYNLYQKAARSPALLEGKLVDFLK